MISRYLENLIYIILYMYVLQYIKQKFILYVFIYDINIPYDKN